MDELKQKILKSIEGCSTKEQLHEYFKRVATALQPKRFSDNQKTLFECIHEFLNQKESPKIIKLKNKAFGSFGEQFFLTPGLHIIAGMTGHGKTVWAMEWAKAAAAENIPSLFLSFEMTNDDMAVREISKETELDMKKLMSGGVSETQREVLREKFDHENYLYTRQIHITRYGTLDWKEIEARFYENFYKVKPGLVILDYIQMLQHSGLDDSTQAMMFSKLAREFKLAADNLGVAFILLSQMNRKANEEIKKHKEALEIGFYPMGHEYIRESGGISEAADSVQCILIPEKIPNCPPQFRGLFQVLVDKSRKLGRQSPALFPIDLMKMKFIERL